MNLLHAHIRNQMPSSFVFTCHSWNLTPAESAVVVTQRLQQIDPAFPRQSITFSSLTKGKIRMVILFFGTHSSRKSVTGFTPFTASLCFAPMAARLLAPWNMKLALPKVYVLQPASLSGLSESRLEYCCGGRNFWKLYHISNNHLMSTLTF
jgi:hypothetical protein